VGIPAAGDQGVAGQGKPYSRRTVRPMEVLVLGPGCANCRKTFERAKEAVQRAGVPAEVRKVEALTEIARCVMLTPGVVVAGNVKCAGRVPEVEETVGWVRTADSVR